VQSTIIFVEYGISGKSQVQSTVIFVEKGITVESKVQSTVIFFNNQKPDTKEINPFISGV